MTIQTEIYAWRLDLQGVNNHKGQSVNPSSAYIFQVVYTDQILTDNAKSSTAPITDFRDLGCRFGEVLTSYGLTDFKVRNRESYDHQSRRASNSHPAVPADVLETLSSGIESVVSP